PGPWLSSTPPSARWSSRSAPEAGSASRAPRQPMPVVHRPAPLADPPWPTTVSKYPTDINDSNLLGLADAADPAAAGAARDRTGAPAATGQESAEGISWRRRGCRRDPA